MRMLGAVLALATVALLASCSGEDVPPEPAASLTAENAADVTCERVRAGIAAFNQGDFEATVDHFRAAVEPAQEYASLDRSSTARDLLLAVEYYADLPAADYPAAFQSSAEFARHQLVTLGQCEGPTVPDGVQA